MCSREEEPLVLQQFLRFGETRPVTQQLILQELSEKNNEEQRARAQVGQMFRVMLIYKITSSYIIRYGCLCTHTNSLYFYLV